MSVTTQGCTLVAETTMDEIDRTVSGLARADCELMRFVHGEKVCQSLPSNEEAEPVYCYRSLGGVDCYDRQDPSGRPILRTDQAEPIRTTDRTVY